MIYLACFQYNTATCNKSVPAMFQSNSDWYEIPNFENHFVGHVAAALSFISCKKWGGLLWHADGNTILLFLFLKNQLSYQWWGQQSGDILRISQSQRSSGCCSRLQYVHLLKVTHLSLARGKNFVCVLVCGCTNVCLKAASSFFLN